MNKEFSKSIAIVLLAVAPGIAQQLPQQADTPSSTRQVPLEEAQQASLVLGDLAEQMRIAQAKLAKPALERKKQIGRLQAYEAAAEEQIKKLAGEVELALSRHQQISEQLTSLAHVRKSQGTRRLLIVPSSICRSANRLAATAMVARPRRTIVALRRWVGTTSACR